MPNRIMLVALLVLASCSEDPDDADASASVDSGRDATVGADASTDAGDPSMDAGDTSDAGGSDAGFDAGPPIDAGPPSTRQTARPLGTTGAGQGYWEYLPPRYGAGDSPLLVFVHGLGENGNGDSELDRVLRGGPPRLIDRDTWDGSLPFIVLSPQHAGGGCTSAMEIRDLIEFAITEYSVDTTRIYLTGLSCGAIGSWDYLGRFLDERVAAAVLIAGNGNPAWSRAGCDLGRIPIWAFHGDADGTVAVGGTINPMTNLMACDPAPSEAVMTIYPGVGHDSWSRTYDGSAGHDIYSWMLRFTHP